MALMTLVSVALKSLRGRLVTTVLTVCSVALAVALVLSTFLLTRGIRDGFIQGTTDFNLLVGAKGSPTQLVLSVIFRIDVPPPNILYTTYEQLHADTRVDAAVPMMLGDAYEGFRYAATTPAYFQPFPWRRKTFTLATGTLLRDDQPDLPAYEALLGAEAARRTGLKLGDRFYSGEEMSEYPLTVVGILRPTHGADDRTIFISLASFWEMNEVSREMTVKPLTAVLVRPKRLSDIPSLHRELNVATESQAVIPSSALLTIFNLLNLAEEVLTMIPAIVAMVMLLHLFVAMYSATRQRVREIATMRALGARRLTILLVVLLESCTITLIGGILGLYGGYGIALLGARIIAERGGVALYPPVFTPLQPLVLASVVGLGTLAGLIPAIMAYRTEVAENLAPLS
jgi:putative ABC transport system permease protein